MFFDSQPGDAIGGGVSRTFTTPEATISATRGSGSGVSVSVIGPSFDYWRYLDFWARPNQPLAPGSYPGATRYPFTQFAGLSVSGDGRGCNELTGRFVVLEAAYAADGSKWSALPRTSNSIAGMRLRRSSARCDSTRPSRL